MARFIPTPDALVLNCRNAIRYHKYLNADKVDSFYIEQTPTTDGFTFAVCAGTNHFNSIVRAGFNTYDEAKSFLDDLVIKINFDTPF